MALQASKAANAEQFAEDVEADDENIVQPFLEEGEEMDNSDPNQPRGIVVCKGYFRSVSL